MDEVDSVLRLIRIDWDETQRNDFNPLKLALNIQNSNSQTAMSYNNIYHKVEQALSKVIDISFKGFSESLVAYKQTCANTNKSLEIINDLQFTVEKIKLSANIDIARLEEKKAEISIAEYLNEDLERLYTFRNTLHTNNESLNGQIVNLVSAVRTVKELKELKPIAHYLNELDAKRKDLISKIADETRKCIFLGEKLSYDPQLIYLLDCYEHLDKTVFKSTGSLLFNKINNMILNIDETKVKEKQEMLAESINNYFKGVIDNYDGFISKLDMYRDKKDNYFEKEMADDQFFVRDNFIHFLKSTLLKLVDQCTIEGRTSERISFSLDEIEDTLDYEKLFGKGVVLKGDEIKDIDDDNGFFLVEWLDFRFIFYLYRNAFKELKTDLFEFLKHRYFSVSKEKIKKKLNKSLDNQYFFKKKNDVLKFVPKIIKLVDQNCFFDSEFGYGNLYLIFNSTFNSFFQNLNILYKNKIVMSAFEDINMYKEINLLGIENDGEAEFRDTAYSIFRKQVIMRRSEPSSLFLEADKYKIGLAAVESIKVLKDKFADGKQKFEKVELNPQLEEVYARILVIEMIYKCAINLQVIADITFLFEHFIKEGRFGKENIFIGQIIDIFRILHLLRYSDTGLIKEIFETLKSYIFSHLSKINVKNASELRSFVDDLKLLEEVACNFEMTYVDSFESVYLFFTSIADNNLDSAEKKDFAKRIAVSNE